MLYHQTQHRHRQKLAAFKASIPYIYEIRNDITTIP